MPIIDDEEYINTTEARRLLGCSTSTLRCWDAQGKIRTRRTPTNHRIYSKEDICAHLGLSKDLRKKRKVCYARVSSRNQLDDLQRQQDFFRDRFPDYELVTDVGSGINWRRKGLKAILESAMSGELECLVVAHRDRLCRFAFELIEWVLERNKVRLVVLDKAKDDSGDVELADDILSIVHVYSCKKMGQRRYSKQHECERDKMSKTQDLPELESEDLVEGVDGDE